MYILTISKRTLQSESNRFCSHKAQKCVDNDRFEDLVSAADLASMGSLEVIMDRREVFEERDVEVGLIDVRPCRQKPVVDRVRVELPTCRRVGGLDLLLFISIDIPSELDRSTPTSFIPRIGVGTRLWETRALSSIVFCIDRGRGPIQLAEFRVQAGWGPSLGRFWNRPASQGSLEHFQACCGS